MNPGLQVTGKEISIIQEPSDSKSRLTGEEGDGLSEEVAELGQFLCKAVALADLLAVPISTPKE